ncbi:MAG TPA: biosynthetic-type acetolactate synthase large subunit [Chloroflexota bacterium]|nr:biosynthetic-type acetolactate synthase large subunit [Chloroflexota bacterium]
MKMNGARILCESLLREGVDTIFGYPGGVVIPLYDILPEFPGLRHILVRHEQAAGHAAEGYARALGKVGVCLATSGPGATNLVTAIADAHMDSVPIVAITGQVPTTGIGRDFFQEIDTTGITLPITKHNYLVRNVSDLARTIKEAFYIASTGRPGPVLVDIPKDVFVSEASFLYPDTIDIPGYKPTTSGNMRQVRQAIEVLKEAKRPLILAGHGVVISRAFDELKAFADRAGIPVMVTLHGLGGYPCSHPLYFGMIGMHGHAHTNLAIQEADLLIGIGMRFDDRVTGKLSTFAPKAKIIHIDIDPAEISKNVKCTVPIVGDIKTVLAALNAETPELAHHDWVNQIEAWRADRRTPQQHPVDDAQPIPSTMPIKEIYRRTREPVVVVADVGQHQMWAAQEFPYDDPATFISSGGLGTMGFCLPAAMGAKVARPEAIVWAIVGDGGFQMTIQELATLQEERIPVKIAIINNGGLGMVRQWQDLFYDKNYVAVKMWQPDFVKICEGYGIPAKHIERARDVGAAVDWALATEGPVLINFKVAAEENVFPMIPAGLGLDDMVEGHQPKTLQLT